LNIDPRSPSIIARAAELGVDRVLEKLPDEGDVMAFIDVAKA